MDSGRSLAQVIMELQNEIQKLETENRELRGELKQVPVESKEENRSPNSMHSLPDNDSVEDNIAHTNLRRNVSAPALEGQFKENVIMTVRRYSVSSNILKLGRNYDGPPRGRKSEEKSTTGVPSKWARLQDGVHTRPQTAMNISTREEGARDRLTNRRSLQDYVNKNRSKVKTVTFLLPVDDIYTNRPVSAKCVPDQSSFNTPVMEDSSG